VAFIAVPLWLTFRRPDAAPDHRQAHAYLRARQALTLTLAGSATPTLVRTQLTKGRMTWPPARQATAVTSAAATVTPVIRGPVTAAVALSPAAGQAAGQLLARGGLVRSPVMNASAYRTPITIRMNR
jgi:hypothetical protein